MRKLRRKEQPADDLTPSLALAYALFALTFRGDRARFWNRMTLTGIALGSLALWREPKLRKLEPSMAAAGDGALSAAGLYAIFRVGDVLARKIMPAGAENIGDIYELRHLESHGRIATRLAAVIGPAEELFWRGFVQQRLAGRLGDTRGAAAASAVYGGAHLITGNPTLLGAATTAGAYWGGLARLGMSMEALIASHLIWDITIFLIAPTQDD